MADSLVDKLKSTQIRFVVPAMLNKQSNLAK
jgi:hypothetical protein